MKNEIIKVLERYNVSYNKHEEISNEIVKTLQEKHGITYIKPNTGAVIAVALVMAERGDTSLLEKIKGEINDSKKGGNTDSSTSR